MLKLLTITITTIAAGLAGYFWIAPLVVFINPIVTIALCALAGLIVGETINYLVAKHYYRQAEIQQQIPTEILPVPAVPLDLTPKQQNVLNKKNWLSRALERAYHYRGISEARRQVYRSLIINLEEAYHQSLFQDIESLDRWVQQNLISNDPENLISNDAEIKFIHNEWTANYHLNKMLLFRRHLERAPQPQSCFKLRDHDFKNMMSYIESFITPSVTKKMFDKLRKDIGYTSYEDFPAYIVLLARENRLAHLKFVLQLHPQSVLSVLPEAILAAAENNHMLTVKELIPHLENKSVVIRELFKIAIKENYKNMLRWLLINYSDEKLINPQLGNNIETQIRFHSVTHKFFNTDPSEHSLLKIYRDIRRQNRQL